MLLSGCFLYAMNSDDDCKYFEYLLKTDNDNLQITNTSSCLVSTNSEIINEWSKKYEETKAIER